MNHNKYMWRLSKRCPWDRKCPRGIF